MPSKKLISRQLPVQSHKKVKEFRSSQGSSGSKDVLDALFAKASDGVVLTGPGPEFSVLYANGAARGMLSAERPEGVALKKLWPKDSWERFYELASSAASDAGQIVGEIDFAAGARSTQNMALTIVPMFSREKAAGVLLFARDVTQARQMQGIILESQKMEALQYFVSGTTKEIQNPLLAVLKNIEKFEQHYRGRSFEYVSYKEFKAMMEFLGQVHQQVRTCYNTTAKLTNLNKKRLHFEANHCSPNDLIREVLRLNASYLRSLDVRIRQRLHKNTPLAAIGPMEFKEIVGHLVDNGAQAMPGGGTLTIETQPLLGGDEVLIKIVDQGVGISPDDLPHIFEPFFTTKPKGAGGGKAGLGLSIVHSLVTGARGRIKVKSSQRRGTEFQVILPIADAGDLTRGRNGERRHA